MIVLSRQRLLGATAAVGTLAALGATACVGPLGAEDGTSTTGQISLRLNGVQAKQLAMVFGKIPAGGYPGEVSMKPSGCKEAPTGNALHPSNIAFDFTIRHPPLPPSTQTELCVFSVLTGEVGVGTGAIVPAKGVPEVEDDEPVFEVRTGYALVGGTWPAAKGRRSRAGAPGTQFALELAPDGTERYYLLNTAGGHKVRVQADNATEVVLFNNTDYVELLPGATQPVLYSLASDQSGKREEFRTLAVAAAARCGLPGFDPAMKEILERARLDKVSIPPESPGQTPANAPKPQDK